MTYLFTSWLLQIPDRECSAWWPQLIAFTALCHCGWLNDRLPRELAKLFMHVSWSPAVVRKVLSVHPHLALTCRCRQLSWCYQEWLQMCFSFVWSVCNTRQSQKNNDKKKRKTTNEPVFYPWLGIPKKITTFIIFLAFICQSSMALILQKSVKMQCNWRLWVALTRYFLVFGFLILAQTQNKLPMIRL